MTGTVSRNQTKPLLGIETSSNLFYAFLHYSRNQTKPLLGIETALFTLALVLVLTRRNQTKPLLGIETNFQALEDLELRPQSN